MAKIKINYIVTITINICPDESCRCAFIWTFNIKQTNDRWIIKTKHLLRVKNKQTKHQSVNNYSCNINLDRCKQIYQNWALFMLTNRQALQMTNPVRVQPLWTLIVSLPHAFVDKKNNMVILGSVFKNREHLIITQCLTN